jgi:Flp pilus assembly protein TadG
MMTHGGARPGDFRPRATPRRGTAVVEFGILAPVLIFLIVGTLEVGRGVIATQALNDAARRGCRNAIHGTTSNATITSDVSDALKDINNPTGSLGVNILVNGQSVDASTAVHGDKISVQATIPASSVYWTAYVFLRGVTLQSEPVVMMRQQ